jgi:flagellar hook-associated protein 3 FlgL
MIAGIEAYNGSFLADLSQTEARIAQANRELSSGYRVNQASDDPSAVAPILDYQNQLAHLTQVQSNLNAAQTDAQTADGALQNAATLIDELVTIAANGANTSTSAATRATLGTQVQAIEQQLVAIANTSVRGRYIFGGDTPSTAPYTYSWTSPEGVVQNSGAAGTSILRDSNGNAINPSLTAAQIFDLRDPTGEPAPGNIFNAAYSLGQALLNNNEAGIQSAILQVKVASDQLGLVTTGYGNTLTWIQQATASATNEQNNVTQALGAIRDTDVAEAATQLTLEQTALEAALSAHGNLNTKSLFSYFG